MKIHVVPRRGWTGVVWVLGAVLALGLASLRLPDARAAAEVEGAPVRLAPVSALGLRLDTLLIGGYAGGSFSDAVRVLGGGLSPEEQSLVGGHLDKIFAGVVEPGGMGRAGRLRVAYERAVRPDGSTRAIRVLAAEAAVAGELHTAFYFEREGAPGYFDPFGRALDPGAWADPLQSPRVTSPFGAKRMHPILRRILPHTGVDYAASAGAPVRATGDGVVSIAGSRGGYGTMVEIQHPSGYSTRYAHLSELGPGVSTGALVRQGDIVGRVGMTGLATGPHLHYEVRRRGRPMDPRRVVAGAGVPAQLEAEPEWPRARQGLSYLLARAPAVLTSR